MSQIQFDKPSLSASKPVVCKSTQEKLSLLYCDCPDQVKTSSLHFDLPSWFQTSFYSRQPDRPFRADKFMPRCKMTHMHAFGLVEHENAVISIPLLPSELTPSAENYDVNQKLSRLRIDHNLDIISCNGNHIKGHTTLKSSLVRDQEKFSARRTNADTSLPNQEKFMRQPSITENIRAISSPQISLSRTEISQYNEVQGSRSLTLKQVSLVKPLSESLVKPSINNPERNSFTPALISRIAAQAKSSEAPSRLPPIRSASGMWRNFFRFGVSLPAKTEFDNAQDALVMDSESQAVSSPQLPEQSLLPFYQNEPIMSTVHTEATNTSSLNGAERRQSSARTANTMQVKTTSDLSADKKERVHLLSTESTSSVPVDAHLLPTSKISASKIGLPPENATRSEVATHFLTNPSFTRKANGQRYRYREFTNHGHEVKWK